jgi:hypothetical protein
VQQLGGIIHSTVVEGVKTGLSQAHDIISPRSDLSLSERVDNATTGFLGFLGIYQIPEVIKSICKDVKKIFTCDDPEKRVRSAGKSIVSSSKLISVAANIGHLLYGIGVIAATAISWTATAFKVLFPVTILDTALSINKTQRHHRFFAEIKGKITPLHTNKKQILSTCRYILKNQEKIEKKLSIGKDAKLGEMAQGIIKGLRCHKKESAAKGKEFLAILQARVDTKLSLEVAHTALKAAAVATGVLMIGTGINPVSVAAAVILGIAQVATYTYDWVEMGPDPFGDATKAWYQKFSDRVHSACIAPVIQAYSDIVSRKEQFFRDISIILR